MPLPQSRYVRSAVRPVGGRETREYDAFGPWMQKVRNAEELPPRFDAFWPELSAAGAVAKVPYPVERRNALPGSDLYERVLALCPDGLVLLAIDGGSVRILRKPYGRLSWIALTTDLLDAHLLLGEGGDWDLPFNAVSEDVALELVDAVRARIRGEARIFPSPGAVPARPPTMEGDFHFEGILSTLRSREDAASLLAYQEPCRVMPPEGAPLSARARLKEALRPTYLDSAMLVELTGEVFAARKGREARRGRRGFWLERAWMPLSAALSPRVRELTLPNGATVFALELGEGNREYLFSSPPEAALARLLAPIPAAV